MGGNKNHLEVKYFNFDDKFDPVIKNLLISNTITALVITIIFAIILFIVYRTYKKVKEDAEEAKKLQETLRKELLDGNESNLNPNKSIYEQLENLPYSKKFEINRDQFIIEHVIGDGQFGMVSLGTAKDIYGTGDTKVAIKQVKNSVDENQLQTIVGELKIMSNLGSHPNLVNLVGACTSEITKNKIYILLEYCSHGDLRKVLLDKKEMFLVNIGQGDGYVDPRFNPNLLLNWCYQTAKGMEYLESLKIMHGDLAARNILIDENFNSKISDFGLSKKLQGYQAYKKENRRMIPWAWMALEYFQTGEFNLKSDVWSFGVVVWEIYSLGSKPYGMEPYDEVKKKLLGEKRLDTPEHMSNLDKKGQIYCSIMESCWEAKPANRPNFKELVGKLEAMMEQGDIEKYNQYVESFNEMQKKRSFSQNEEYNRYIIDNKFVEKEENQAVFDSNGYIIHASVKKEDDNTHSLNSPEYVFYNNTEKKEENAITII